MNTGKIQDKDVKDALETLIYEFEERESQINDLEKSENELLEKVDSLEAEVEELKSTIKELEEALAEAYLTSEADDGGRTAETEEHKLLGGRSPDVPDSTDNKASD